MGENARAKRIFRALAENAPSLAQGTLRMYLYCVFMEPEIQDYKTVSELVLKTPRSEEQESCPSWTATRCTARCSNSSTPGIRTKYPTRSFRTT
jgi:hypothetical protein